MNTLLLGLLRCWLLLTDRDDRDHRDDRGDVPGWVLITVMSVGIVLAIWTVAQDQLTAMLRSALSSVQ